MAFDLAECRKFDHFAIILLLFYILFLCFLLCLIYRISELALFSGGIILIVIGVIQRHSVTEFVMLVLSVVLFLKDVMAHTNHYL